MEKHFESVCGSKLWDPETVFSRHPDFTPCFQKTFLVWTPCFILWFCAPIWMYNLAKDAELRKSFRLSWLVVSKAICTVLLTCIEVYNLISVQEAFMVNYMTPLILILSYVLVLAFVLLEYLARRRYSLVLFAFWFLLTLFAFVPLRTNVIRYFEDKQSNFFDRQTSPFYAYFVLVFANTIMSTMSQKFPDRTPEKEASIQQKISLLSMIFFWWTNPLIKLGYKRDLTVEDLWTIDKKEKSEHLCANLETEWNKAAKPYLEERRRLNIADEPKKDKKKKSKAGAKFNPKTEKAEETVELNTTNGSEEVKIVQKIRKPSLGWAMIKVYVSQFLVVLCIKVIHDLLNFARPILLDKMITFIKIKEQNTLLGVFYIFVLCFTSFLQTILIQHFYHAQFLNGNRMKIALMNMIYRKSFKLSVSARKTVSVGEMTNLITSNAMTLEHSPFHLIQLISAPLQIFISTYMLWQYLGPATLVGLASMVVFIPLNTVFARLTKKITRKRYEHQDKRLKMMNEIFNGIRVVKLYGWEVSFRKIVIAIRKNELASLVKSSIISTCSGFVWACVPFVVATVSFATYLLLDKKNNLDPNTAFVSLTLFNMLRFPLNVLPYVITGFINLNVSMTRIRKFLLKEESLSDDVTHELNKDEVVTMKNVNLGWNKKDATLKNINLSVKSGELVAVVGKVGSGKSSLLSGLLGEMHKLNQAPPSPEATGLINVYGKTAYVPQQAWIQNNTLRNNILFGNELDEDKYQTILEACSLLADIEIMAAGDETEIGEKGINLSGGQKQRVSLARALYSNADVYFLDDALSAVDSHVGKHIFTRVIGPDGLLKNKTRIFVTNSLSFLPQVDRVVMIDAGEILETGKYDELKAKNGPFAEFIKTYQTSQTQVQDETKPEDQENTEASKKKAGAKKGGPESPKGKDGEKVGQKIIQKEKVETGRVKMATVLEYLKVCKIHLSVVFLVLYLASYAADIGSNFWLSDWADETRNASVAEPKKFFRLGVYTSLGFSECLLTFLANLSFLAMYIKATTLLHNKMLHSVLRSPLRFFESTPTGRILNRFTNDISATEGSIPSSIESLLSCFLSIASVVIVITRSTPLFLVALVPITIFYFAVQRYYVPSSRQMKRMQSVSKSPIYAHFSESQMGVSTIKAFNSERRFIETMEKNIDHNLEVHFAQTVSSRWLALRLEIIGNLITIFAAAFAIISRDTLTAGLAGMSISISLKIGQTLSWFVRTVSEFEVNITAVERIKEYCDLHHEDEWEKPDQKPPASWPDSGEIVFSNYKLKYRPELENVLDDLSFHVKPGEKIGICGRTGAGKSSLALGLFRMLEDASGEIVIDNVNIKNIGLHDLRQRITIIPQDPIIFSGSIKMNLDPFERYDDKHLWEALELSNLKSFIQGTEKGLVYECTEGGENLSVGQRQLICLARALLRKTNILVLDEATASVDHNTDELIQSTISSQFTGCTVLTIAHRLNTIMDYDRVMVLDKGKIVEFDKPKVLLQNPSSSFYSLAKSAKLV